MAKLDIVFINPGDRKKVYQSLGRELSAIEPPVWAGMMATYARGKGCAVQLIDANAEALAPDEVAQQVEAMAPRLAVIVVYGHQPSASTQNMPACSAIATAIKQQTPGQPVLLVGGHVAALPERSLREEDVDFVAGDEGLQAITGLVDALAAGDTDYGKIPGLWYWEGDAVKANLPAPLLKNLDEAMPGLAWDLLPMDRYRAHNWHCFDGLQRQPYAAVYTTLGCPYHCTFCCIQAPFKGGEGVMGLGENVNSYRRWSVDAVMAQIDTLVNDYGVRNIKFADELFVLNPRHVLGICDQIIQRGYDLNIWAYARVDSIRDNMLEKLKAAGVNWLALGIESAAQRVRSSAQKDFDQDYLHEIVDAIRAADIYIIGNYIFGLPEDDCDTMQQTLDMALELNCEFANFYSAMAYPGSALYAQAVAEGWPLPESWSGYSQHAVDTLPLPTKYVSGPEVLRFRDEAFQVYFHHAPYLDRVERTFGAETRAHVLAMASHRLEREHAVAPNEADCLPAAR